MRSSCGNKMRLEKKKKGYNIINWMLINENWIGIDPLVCVSMNSLHWLMLLKNKLDRSPKAPRKSEALKIYT